MRRRDFLLSTLATGAVFLRNPGLEQAYAQGPWSSRTVRWVVPYTAGGPVDVIARRVAQAVTEQTTQSIIIENKAGAAGAIGSSEVARSAPDGTTFLVTVPDPLINYAALWKKPLYDSRKEFQLLTQIADTGVVMMCNSNAPFRTLAELSAFATQNPAKVTYGSWGRGSFPHILAETMRTRNSTPMTEIPYGGTAPAVKDMIAGHIMVAFGSVSEAVQLASSGQAKALAVTGNRRLAALPSVPTFSEQGFAGGLYDMRFWVGLIAPQGLSPATKEVVVSAVKGVLGTPEITRFFETVGWEAMGSSSERFEQDFDKQFPLITEAIRSAGVEPQ